MDAKRAQMEVERERVQQYVDEIKDPITRGIIEDHYLNGKPWYETAWNAAQAILSMMDTLTNYAAGMSNGQAVDASAMVDYATNLGKIMSGSFDAMKDRGFYTAFLYSTKRTLLADAISFSRGVVLKAAAIFCLPVLLGGDTIWLAPLAAEMLTLLPARLLFKTSNLTGRKIDKINL